MLFLEFNSICANLSDFLIALENNLGSKNMVTCLIISDKIKIRKIIAYIPKSFPNLESA